MPDSNNQHGVEIWTGHSAAHDAARARVNRLADLLDTRFRLPVLGYRFGYDSLIGLIPGVGDVATALCSIYLIFEAHRAGANGRLVVRMLYNMVVDLVLGSVPIFGDIFDFAFMANRINANLLKEHYEKLDQKKTKPPR